MRQNFRIKYVTEVKFTNYKSKNKHVIKLLRPLKTEN